MFWNDIADINKTLSEIKERLNHIDRGVIENLDAFCSEEEYSPMNRLHEKLDSLIKDADRVQKSMVAEQTMDKFEDYMKNVDKLNGMINEFKGCVSMARGAISEGKELSKEVEGLKDLSSISRQIFIAMQKFIQAGNDMETKAYFKLDAIYKAICEKQEKKSPERRKKRSCSTPSI